jgi:ammonia channel protein AmtB
MYHCLFTLPRTGFIGNWDFALSATDSKHPAPYAFWFWNWAFAAASTTILSGAIS